MDENKSKPEQEEMGIKLGELKNKFKSFLPKKESKQVQEQTKSEPEVQKVQAKQEKEELAVNSEKLKEFTKKHKSTIFTILAIILVIFAASYFRAMPASLPITNDWADNTVNEFYANQFTGQVNSQYPHLPEQNRNQLIQSQVEQFKAENKQQIKQETKQLASQYKTNFQDEDGQTYLLAIDPWLWYGYAKNLDQYGHYGNTKVDGQSWYTLRNGRIGQSASVDLLVLMGVIIHKLSNPFTGLSLLGTFFYLPVILIALSAVATYFMVERVTRSRIGGIIAGIVLGIHGSLLSRTAAGFTDTDNIITFFTSVSLLFFTYALTAKKRKTRLLFMGLTGLSIAGYFIGHQSWWNIFDIMIAALGVHLLISFLNKENRKEKVKESLEQIGAFLLSTWFFGILFMGLRGISPFTTLKNLITVPFIDPLRFISRKEVASVDIWPNVLTTVAELNNSSSAAAISQIGGTLLFVFALAGLAFIFISKMKKREKITLGVLITLWFVSSFYASIKGVRFIALLVPPFAVSLGIFAGIALKRGPKVISKAINVKKTLSSALIILVAFLVIILPLIGTASAVGKSQVPSFNDAWHTALTSIKDNSEDAIITSWWDFGHWFVAVAERRVTFDGGNQGRRIHWVGKSLLTADENEAVGILKMLNCGQEEAAELLEQRFDGDTRKAVDLLNEIMLTRSQTAAQRILEANGVENTQEILAKTHCEDVIDQYFITSEDMVGKAGVWGHFGSWDFQRAEIYQRVRGLDNAQAITLLREEYNFEDAQARTAVNEIKTTPADQWISPWPGYQGGGSCVEQETNYECQINLNGNIGSLTIEKGTWEANIATNAGQENPVSLTYVENGQIKNKEFEDPQIGFSIVLAQNNQLILADPLQADSMFTKLFFLEGEGLNCFEKFDDRSQITGGRIIAWTVDLTCTS